MKKLISIVLLINIFCQGVFAASQPVCDWNQIKQLPDGGYEYDPQLNICVGNLVEQNKIQAEQIADYQKAIQLKDLALTQSDQRAQMWSNTSDQLENRLQTVDSEEKKNQWLYFGLGILTTFAAAYTAGKLMK